MTTLTWLVGGAAPSGADWISLATDDAGTWVAIATGSTSTMYSTNNGATWTAGGAAPSTDSWNSLVTDGVGHWVAIANSSTNTMISSNNGVTWTAGGAAPSTPKWNSLATDKVGNWVAISGGSTATMISSNNGVTWSAGGAAPSVTSWASLATDGKGNWVAISATTTATMISSNNGVTWTAGGAAPSGYTAIDSLATDGKGKWVAISGGSTATMISSNNGVTWSAGGAAPSAAAWISLATDGKGNWVALVQNSTVTMVSTNNGVTWTVDGAATLGSNWASLASDSKGTWVAIAAFSTATMISPLNGVLFVDVPGTYDVGIANHGYMIDTTFEFGRRDSFRHSSIPAQRTATDITNQPGEATINPEGLWRSEMNDWSLGSGQLFADRKESVPNRYHHGQGVDVFSNKWYASLLNDTTQLVADTDTTCQVLVVGVYLIKLNASGVSYSTNGTSYTAITGLSGTPVSMCTDGASLYIACGSGGVYTCVAGAWTTSHLVNVTANNVTFVAYCSNVLLVGNTNSLYQVSGAITTWPTALITQSASTWLWNSACGGLGWIYVGGYSGGTAGTATVSAVYKTQFVADGTTLAAPTIATPLPPGETVYSLFTFVNYILMGTSLGLRFCQTLGVVSPSGQDTGLLKIGPIIPNLQEKATKPVRCFTANQRFIYFGWSNYSASAVKASATVTGLGWMDISNFTGEQTPAYTSHMMVSGTGEITSMDWWIDAPVFVVQGKGVYSNASTYVPSGNIYSGYIGFRIPDQKIIIGYSVDTTSTAGSVTASINQDDLTTNPLGTSSGSNILFQAPQISGELFETNLTLTATSANAVATTVRRATLQAFPAITAGKFIITALRFWDQIETKGGRRQMNVYAELAFLEGLRLNQTVVTYQEGMNTWAVVVDDIDFVEYMPSTLPAGGFQGILMCKMKTATSGLIT